MKICFLCHNLKNDNGAGVFSERLIRGLKEKIKCEVVALTTEQGGISYEIPILYPDKKRLAREIFRIRRIFKICDVIHALDGFPYGVIAVLASLGLKKKVIITAAGSGAILPLYHRYYAPIMKYCYRKAGFVTAISNFTKDEILKKINVPIHVITHGVDFNEFARENGGVSFARPYVLSVGALRWRKGYHLSIEAFAKVRRYFPEMHYVILGKRHNQDYYDELRSIRRFFELENNVHFFENVEKREDIAALYQNAECFVLQSQNVNHDIEGFGLVFLEAAAAGLPVVGSKNCGVDDAICDGKNGFLVDSSNPENFADAILAILRNKELKNRMRNESITFAKACGWGKKMNEYAKIYQELET